MIIGKSRLGKNKQQGKVTLTNLDQKEWWCGSISKSWWKS